MPIKARTTGIFSSSGAVLKWLSISFAPAKSSLKLSIPINIAIDRPIDDHKEYLPPTQS